MLSGPLLLQGLSCSVETERPHYKFMIKIHKSTRFRLKIKSRVQTLTVKHYYGNYLPLGSVLIRTVPVMVNPNVRAPFLSIFFTKLITFTRKETVNLMAPLTININGYHVQCVKTPAALLHYYSIQFRIANCKSAFIICGSAICFCKSGDIKDTLEIIAAYLEFDPYTGKS